MSDNSAFSRHWLRATMLLAPIIGSSLIFSTFRLGDSQNVIVHFQYDVFCLFVTKGIGVTWIAACLFSVLPVMRRAFCTNIFRTYFSLLGITLLLLIWHIVNVYIGRPDWISKDQLVTFVGYYSAAAYSSK